MKAFIQNIRSKSFTKEIRDAIVGRDEPRPKPKELACEFNLAIIGDPGVGKSSIVESYAFDTFCPEY